jgi:acetoin utilization protein AcuC
MGQVALHMFAGTVRLTEKMLAGELKVGFNPQGAKHHAQYNHSSGFCVFNDMAWAAREFQKNGMKVMYIDWDAHHGDGVENLLTGSIDLTTCSIHDSVIFPGTGLKGHFPELGVYNWALDPASGDDEFRRAMGEIEQLADKLKPDVVLVATGADAHKSDPLSTLQFDYPGYEDAASTVGRIASTYSEGRVLIGGAGGYQPFDHTPEIWAKVVARVHDEIMIFS